MSEHAMEQQEQRRGRHRAEEPDQDPAPDQDADLPPDAAARDASRRAEAGDPEPPLGETDISFVTRGVSAEERAAVIAVLTQVREEETQQVKRVARRDREPWARSQRVPEGIYDLLAEG
ncbi:hypothetical protein [Leucobacter luti]|uniref:hypothetical protein n=1 Tax=Leucobacter luti TaxID=340320 RepID=UPI003D04A52C